MPRFLQPGVYVQEVPSGDPSIVGVATIPAFIGAAPRGPVDTPVRVADFAAYEQEFGDSEEGGMLGHAVRLYFLHGGTEAYVVRVVRDGDAAASAPPSIRDVLGNEDRRTGLHALEDADFNLLCIPPLLDEDGKELDASGLWPAAAEFCAAHRAFLLIDPPAPWETVADALAGGLALRSSLAHADHAALYFPRLVTAHPTDPTRTRALPPGGAIAGVIVRTDATRGVWKAPAGTDARLHGTQGLSVTLRHQENEELNAQGINCLRTFPAQGTMVWGARTISSDPEWKYISVRRLALFLEESLYRGTQWAVFEPNDAPLWARLRLQVNAFLDSMYRQGALMGSTPREAYFVRCDETTTSPHDIAQGFVQVLVGFAPLRPAEFVVLRIRQRTMETESIGTGGGVAPLAEESARTHDVLDVVGQRLETRKSWEDLVLPEDSLQSLRQMVSELEHQRTVYEEWGFGARSGAGRGVSALFAGPSGTGKTLAAQVVAGALGLDLYRVDLTAVVDKYIGETEKNLGRIFDAAEQQGAVLFFDEADALFGKRTDVRDSHDRYANVETSYLLQRLERFDGLAILTSNARDHLDDAFSRRLGFVLDFPFPDPSSRRRIWARVIPAEAPREDLDFTELCEAQLTGGDIRNAALHAAFLAARRGKHITQEFVREGVRVVLARARRIRGRHGERR